MESLERFDVALFRMMNGEWHAPILDAFFLWLTRPPHRAPLFLALFGLLLWTGRRRGREAALALIFAVALADQLSSNLIKDLVDRVRPCFALEDVRLLWPRQAHSPAFPSSHATNSFAVATVLWRVGGMWRWCALVTAALVAYSRVYVGVHYPFDIAGGALLGVSIGLAVNLLWIRLERRRRPPPTPSSGPQP